MLHAFGCKSRSASGGNGGVMMIGVGNAPADSVVGGQSQAQDNNNYTRPSDYKPIYPRPTTMPVKRSGGDPSGAPKRTRFASPPPSAGEAGPSRSRSVDDNDDRYLEQDITESTRGAKLREKRSLRDTEGYDSDSDNDEESKVLSRRSGAQEDGEDEDEDMDMFADEPAPDKGKEKEKPKDKEKFMDLNDIEGQEFDEPSAPPLDEDSDSEAEPVEKKTGLDGDMGVDLTPFNMKKEMQEGRFTEGGEVYMENTKDPHEKHDVWLDSMDKDEIKKARRAHRERERLEREREQREAELESGAGSEEREQKLLKQAMEHMERGETVLEALQRLGKEAEKKAAASKKKSWVERQRERKAALEGYVYGKSTMLTSSGGTTDSFTQLSSAVSDLTAMSKLDVYALSREAISRMIRQPDAPASAPASTPAAPVDTRAFQYRFSMAYINSLPEGQRPIEREVFGPFSASQLRQWKATGFFGPQCENVELRVVGADSWGSWADVVDKV